MFVFFLFSRNLDVCNISENEVLLFIVRRAVILKLLKLDFFLSKLKLSSKEYFWHLVDADVGEWTCLF